ncbi:MAG: hypothetical protein JW394_0922 [Nitrospira sp.]|nr:hypothetical protein [Nitrospira sp.]
MAFSLIASGNPHCGNRKRRPSVQGHQPPHRAREPGASAIPLHRFREGQFGDQLWEELLQDHLRRTPIFLLHRKEIVPLWRLANLQILNGDSLPCSKSCRRSSRLAGWIVGHRLGRPHRFLNHRGLQGCETLDHQGQAARGAQGANGMKRHPLILEQLLSRIFKGRQGWGNELIGQFFYADLEQELGRRSSSTNSLFHRRSGTTRGLSLCHESFCSSYERRATVFVRGPETFAPSGPIPRLSNGWPIAARSSI